MKGYVDVSLAAPILVVAVGNTGEDVKRIIGKLRDTVVPIDPKQFSDTFAQTIESKKMPCPQRIRAKYFKCKNLSEFLLLRERVRDESQLFHLKCYSVLVIIDVTLNHENFLSITQQMKSFMFEDESVSYLYYRASPELAPEFSESAGIGVTFVSYNDPVAINSINTLAIPQVVAALERKIRAVPNLGRSKRKSIEQIISNNVLMFCSVDTSDVISTFNDVIRQMNDSKETNSPRIGAVYELMGLFAREFCDDLRRERLLEKVGSPSGKWAVSDSVKEAVKDSSKDSKKDVCIFLFAAAAEAYSRSSAADKVPDVLLRIVAAGGLEWIDKCVQAINKHRKSLLMSARAWELMKMTAAQGKEKKVILLAHQFHKCFDSDDQKTDFTLEVIRLLGEQGGGPMVMRELLAPAVFSLFTRPLDPARVCAIVLDLLSRAGTLLNPEQQERLFQKLETFGKRDIIIPCNLGLQAMSAAFGKVVMRVLKSEETQGSSSRGPFLYSFFGNKNTNSMAIESGVGWPLKVEVELFNPFRVDLPVVLTLKAENCKCVGTPVTLSANSKQKVECTIFPQCPGDFEITSAECLIYEGVQIIDLPHPLTGKVYDGTVQFACRTDLPVAQSLNLFVGERLSFHIWITNTGMIPLETLEVKFSGIEGVDVTPVSLPLGPSDGTVLDVSFTVTQNMKEIDFMAVAGSSGSPIKSMISVHQAILVQSAIVISSIEPALSLPASNAELSELIFLAVNISNYSDSVFHYSASFAKSAQTSLGLKGIVSNTVQHGNLAPEQTTAFILAIEKGILREAAEVADPKKVINAVKQEEELKGKKISSSERPAIKKRVGIATFIESNLILDWKCGGGRKGRLTDTVALPVPAVLEELALDRPRVKWCFVGCEDNTVTLCKPVEFDVTYEATEVRSCSIVLGKYLDPDFGVAWNGSLTQENTKGDNKFSFVLFFAQPGEFTFQIEYCTKNEVTGQSSVTVVVQ